MRNILLVLFTLTLHFYAQSQVTRNVGVIVMIEDSLTHHFMGSSVANNFVQKYPTTTDFQFFATDTALVLLEENIPGWDFCTLESHHFLEYEENREKLRATDFRNFREAWFNTLKEKYEVDAILVIRNSTDFTDGILWSNTNIKGYGIYNGPRRSQNFVYIQLEFLFFNSGRPLTHIQGPIFNGERNYPRADKKDVLFDESELLLLEEPLKQLIVNQVGAAISNANLLRGLR